MMWACIAAAAAHLAAGVLVASYVQPEGSGKLAPAMTVRYLMALQLQTAAQGAAVPEVSSLPEAGSTGSTGVEPAAATAEGQNRGDANNRSKRRRYFDVSEVDTPAAPTPDWALDLGLLTHNGVQSLKVEVLVSETGRAERCTVLSMQPLRPALRRLIARQLCETQLTPAIRSGVAVPSVRHVEILIADE